MKNHQNIVFAILSMLCSQVAMAQNLTRADSLIKQLHNSLDKHIMVTAHRGDWRNAPENSLQAFKNAIRMGVDIVELDNHTIPTLEEVMLLVKGKVLINLDKSYPYYNEAYAILEKTGTLKQAIFKTDQPLDKRTKISLMNIALQKAYADCNHLEASLCLSVFMSSLSFRSTTRA